MVVAGSDILISLCDSRGAGFFRGDGNACEPRVPGADGVYLVLRQFFRRGSSS